MAVQWNEIQGMILARSLITPIIAYLRAYEEYIIKF